MEKAKEKAVEKTVPVTEVLFSEYPISPKLIEALTKQGITSPTPIQVEALPILLTDSTHFIGQAQTGTGKTLAFLLPLLTKLQSAPAQSDVLALILTPTRELAKQVTEEAHLLLGSSFDRPIQVVPIYGGSAYAPQVEPLRRRRAHVVVGTPGRIMDLHDQGLLNLSSVKHLILDEADEMLNRGFLDAVKFLMESTNSPTRKVWMFSATLPHEIKSLITKFLPDHREVRIQKTSTPHVNIAQFSYVVNDRSARPLLARLVQSVREFHGIVFCQTKSETTSICEYFLNQGLKALALNGDLSQKSRDEAMAKFREGKVRVLIATDVAARGIDVDDLTHVINYGLPQDLETYVHRIGRTGRGGKSGVAWTIVGDRSTGRLRQLERMLRTEIPRGAVPTLDDLKKSIYLEKLEKLKGIITKVQEKGNDFKIDKLVDQFKLDLSDLTQKDFEQMTKVLFTILFNKDFINLDQLPPIDANSGGAYSSSSSSSNSNYRGGGSSSYRGSRGGGSDRSSGGGSGYRSGGSGGGYRGDRGSDRGGSSGGGSGQGGPRKRADWSR
ncbi:MAG: DEAD/DEAH box helicase [Bacteriovoracaceae bacterium]|nr:DEAD/DEAH box helicase [Bacteriovoracaceae bacterium]